ncbi:GNAT family N-acetyltransferase [Actinoplanes italicus]|uniref:RimJ/RimL family protein N-acetyltransferase n=1 Tax=Actinoplanes italicus TaxID=113567 RepID=A0A2T0JWL8_9ACTN|nr:GNAT family protein [Actinoplanes italicus]PRX12151.1 RimJ/RimL family protein N-acetyltransferase [Actinoplanes italicus]
MDHPVLHGRLVRLEPLDRRHVPGLAAAAAEDRSRYAWTWVPDPGTAAAYVDEQLATARTGRLLPYAQICLSSHRVVGVTAYWDPRPFPSGDRLAQIDVGFTWLAASAQGSGLNLEAKYLLFRHAFEAWEVVRVGLSTDARNARSRAAIAGTGARFEGVLRNWSRSWAPGESGLRDSALYSVVAEEWPECRAYLEHRLSETEQGAAAAAPRTVSWSRC